MSDQMREEFEEWWCSEMHGRALLDEFDRSIGRKAWQASRASLCVELPDGFSYDDSPDTTGWALDADRAIEAITKTGVRVK